MSRPKLSQRQLQRIRSAQQRRRRRVDARTPDAAPGKEQRGTLIAHHGGRVLVEDEIGGLHSCVPRRTVGPLVAGDEVVWAPDGHDAGTVLAAMPRRTILTRPDGAGRPRVIAANVDRLLVVISAVAELNLWQIDRFLIAGEHAGIAPALLANKADRLAPEEQQAIADALAPYARLGYPLVFTSALTGQGLEKVQALLCGRTSVFVGQSGVGKSSLVNAVLPAAGARVGETSEATGKGRHTTTTARLYRLPGGGSLIDSPGVREFGLSAMDAADLAQAFVEFRPYLGTCRFRDCRHRLQDEADCALATAVEDGRIEPRRLESYRRMLSFFEASSPMPG